MVKRNAAVLLIPFVVCLCYVTSHVWAYQVWPPLGGGLLLACIASIIWAYFDARARGKSGCLVALMVFFLAWPAGLILWLIFRPENR